MRINQHLQKTLANLLAGLNLFAGAIVGQVLGKFYGRKGYLSLFRDQ
jgi:hypothetical protein